MEETAPLVTVSLFSLRDPRSHSIDNEGKRVRRLRPARINFFLKRRIMPRHCLLGAFKLNQDKALRRWSSKRCYFVVATDKLATIIGHCCRSFIDNLRLEGGRVVYLANSNDDVSW